MKRIAYYLLVLTLFFLSNPAFSQPVMEFDGVDDYIAVPEFFYSGDGYPEVTAEAWIKTTASNGFITSWDRSAYWRLELVGGKVRWDVNTNSGLIDFAGNATVNDDNWHHVAGVYDNGTLRIFVDGNLDASTTKGTTFGECGSCGESPRYGFIGTGSEAFSYDGSHSGTEFNGQIDEVRVWNVALNQATLNEWMGKALTTSHPEFNNLAWASASMDFDGNNDYITAGDVAFMDAPGAFTVEMWFKRHSDQYSSTNSNHNIGNVLIGQSSSSSNDNLEIGTNGTSVEVYIDSDGGQDGKESYSANVQNNEWHHIALTYDQNVSTEAKIYLDGGLIGQSSAWSSVLDNSGSSPLTFGIARGGSSNWGDFDGQIDEIRIFDVALDQATIQEYMYKGVNTHPNLADLQIYYPIYVSGNSTSTVADVDGTDITADGTMVGMDPTGDRVMEATFAIPTLSQWGVIILSLLTLSLVTLMVGNKKLVLAGSNLSMGLVETAKQTFDKRRYFKILRILLPTTLLAFSVIHIVFGSNGLLDLTGTLISSLILAYIVQLYSHFRESH